MFRGVAVFAVAGVEALVDDILEGDLAAGKRETGEGSNNRCEAGEEDIREVAGAG